MSNKVMLLFSKRREEAVHVLAVHKCSDHDNAPLISAISQNIITRKTEKYMKNMSKKPRRMNGAAIIVYLSAFFCKGFLEALCKSRNDLVEIAYYAVVSYVEDRCVLILVDGDDKVGLLHTCNVLDGSGDTDCEVNLRSYCLTGLSNLEILGLPA